MNDQFLTSHWSSLRNPPPMRSMSCTWKRSWPWGVYACCCWRQGERGNCHGRNSATTGWDVPNLHPFKEVPQGWGCFMEQPRGSKRARQVLACDHLDQFVPRSVFQNYPNSKQKKRGMGHGMSGFARSDESPLPHVQGYCRPRITAAQIETPDFGLRISVFALASAGASALFAWNRLG